MKYPDVCQIFWQDCYVFVFTSVDHVTDEGTVQFFPSKELALEWVHDGSLQQFPEWHAEHCPTCARARRTSGRTLV